MERIYMNKKGFTLIEVMAVIVILGILSTVATMEVTKYRRYTNEKEIVNLRSTIEDCFDDYRNAKILSGNIPEKSISTADDNQKEQIFKKFFNELSYDGKKIDIDNTTIKLDLKVKGDLIDTDTSGTYNYSTKYPQNDENLKQYAKDKTCLIESTGNGKEDNEVTSQCITPVQPSKEEVLCIYLKVNEKTLMDDLGTKDSKMANTNNLCCYFNKDNSCEVSE